MGVKVFKIDFEFQSMPNSAVDRYGHILGARNSDFSFLIGMKRTLRVVGFNIGPKKATK